MIEAPRYEVVGGGTPSPEQAAALVVALAPSSARAATPVTPTPTAWQRAALLDATGQSAS